MEGIRQGEGRSERRRGDGGMEEGECGGREEEGKEGGAEGRVSTFNLFLNKFLSFFSVSCLCHLGTEVLYETIRSLKIPSLGASAVNGNPSKAVP